MYRSLVFEEWWTEERGEADKNGVYATDGFKSDYRVTAQKGALSGQATAAVDDENGTVTVELCPPSEKRSKGGDGSEGRGKRDEGKDGKRDAKGNEDEEGGSEDEPDE